MFFDIRREIHNLWIFHLPSPPLAAPAARPRWAQKVNLLLWKKKLWLFSNLPNSPRTLPVHDVIHIPLVLFSIWDFYFDISEWHILPARVWTPALMLHLTNPCAKQKVLSLTKPKGKIYKRNPSAIILQYNKYGSDNFHSLVNQFEHLLILSITRRFEWWTKWLDLWRWHETELI